MHISADNILNHAAIVITSNEHNLREYLWSRYIEVFGSERLCKVLHDGHLPQDGEVIPASAVSNTGEIFLCRFESKGEQLFVNVRTTEHNLVDILVSPHRVVFLPKADTEAAIAAEVVNDVLSGLTDVNYSLALC